MECTILACAVEHKDKIPAQAFQIIDPGRCSNIGDHGQVLLSPIKWLAAWRVPGNVWNHPAIDRLTRQIGLSANRRLAAAERDQCLNETQQIFVAFNQPPIEVADIVVLAIGVVVA